METEIDKKENNTRKRRGLGLFDGYRGIFMPYYRTISVRRRGKPFAHIPLYSAVYDVGIFCPQTHNTAAVKAICDNNSVSHCVLAHGEDD